MRRNLIHFTLALTVMSLGAFFVSSTAQASFSQGFETDTAGWYAITGYGVVDRVASLSASGGYADGIASSGGSYHGRLAVGTCDEQQTNHGLQPLCYGPYTRWGGYGIGTFPPGGWTTQVDVYLDVGWAMANPADQRFDFASAVNKAGLDEHLRDFVFNIGTDADGFVISASPNSTRADTNPDNPSKAPIHITQSGWYTLWQDFDEDANHNLAVDMKILDVSSGATVGHWTLPRPSPDPANEPATPIEQVGCNRYGWFVNQEIPGLAIDNAVMTGGCGAGSIEALKFYDANANGVNDAEQPIAGWEVAISGVAGSPFHTDANGLVATDVADGDYTVTEGTPVEANWIHTTDSSVDVTVDGAKQSVEFGNVCVGAGGGLTLGFWSNKNGHKLVGSGDLAVLRSLNLVRANGNAFNPTEYSDLKRWLLKATATNMAYMLSAQLAAMKLNVENGKVDGGSLIYAPGALSANGLGFATVDDVMAEANAELGLHGLTGDGSPYRGYQEALKNALDKANNNLSFVQPEACSFSFPAE